MKLQLTPNDLETLELLGRMHNLLQQFEDEVRRAGVKSIPISHPLPNQKIALHDLVVLTGERMNLKLLGP